MEKWFVNGVECDGCSVCLDCPTPDCPPVDHTCQVYHRSVDEDGCVLCPVCEKWKIPHVNSNGFIQVEHQN